MKSRFLFAAAAALLLTAAASPQPSNSAARWEVSFGDYQCSLVRHSGGPDALVVRRIPGSRSVEVHWVNGDLFKSAQVRNAQLFLEPGHAKVEDFDPHAHENKQGLGSLAVHYSFLNRLASAQSIELRGAGDSARSIRVPGAARAVEAFAACNNKTVRDFGGDPAFIESLRALPRGPEAESLITDVDYPVTAIKDSASGTVLFRADVGANGRVDGCTVVASSGRPDLDGATCRIVRQRARYQPAVGPDGRPVAAPVFARMVWNILA